MVWFSRVWEGLVFEVHYRLPSGINAVVRDTSIVKSLRLEVVDAMRRLETVEEKFDKRIEGAQLVGSQGACTSFSV